MKRTIKKTISCLVAVLCLVTCLHFPASAASGKISFNDPTVTVGDTVTVKMKLSGTGLIAMDATLTYDTNLLEFQSSNYSGVADSGTGSIYISWFDSTGMGVDSASISFTFKAKTAGTAIIKPESVEVTDINETNVDLTSYGSSKVTIKPVVTASSEARLSSLKVSPGKLSPSFDPDTTSYSVTVPAGTTKLTVTAKAKDGGADTSVSGTKLSVGTNTVTVTVTAEDGTTKKYTIKVTRPADPVDPDPDPEPKPDPQPDPVVEPLTVVIDQTTWYVDEGMDGIAAPEGFEKSLYTYREREIVVAKGADKPLMLMHLTDENEENGALFIYNADKDAFVPYREVNCDQKAYTLMPLEENTQIPAGYALSEGYALGQQLVTAYVSQDNRDALPLVYAMNPAGECSFYRYDPVEGTLQRYVADVASVAVVPEDEEEDPGQQEALAALQQENEALKTQLAQQNQTDGEDDLRLLILFCACAVELLVIIILIIVLCTRKRSGGGGYHGSRSA